VAQYKTRLEKRGGKTDDRVSELPQATSHWLSCTRLSASAPHSSPVGLAGTDRLETHPAKVNEQGSEQARLLPRLAAVSCAITEV